MSVGAGIAVGVMWSALAVVYLKRKPDDDTQWAHLTFWAVFITIILGAAS